MRKKMKGSGVGIERENAELIGDGFVGIGRGRRKKGIREAPGSELGVLEKPTVEFGNVLGFGKFGEFLFF
jgi:hypothetical protein